MFKVYPTMFLAASLFLLISCNDDKVLTPSPISYPAKAIVNKTNVIYSTTDGVKVYNGGFGSSIASNEEGVYYIMTDRGPNIDGNKANEKIFSNPDFNPQIGKFKLVGDSLVFQSLINLKTEAGVLITGLPNPAGTGGTGETAVDINGGSLTTDINGLDPEGLVVLSDGSFWVSDEYGPHIVHFDASGRTLERINPFGSGVGGKKIPAVFAKRRANRGMEGMAITPDNKYIVGMMQSPLYNPDSKVKNTAKILRILFYEISTGKSKEYLYELNSVDYAVSEIVAITNNTFLVLERDGNLPGKDATNFKRIFKIDISNASDVTSVDATGKMINGKTIEQSTISEVNSAGINFVSKEEAFDIMTIPNYAHDKPEGIVIINNNMIGIINDDDFGIGGVGTYTQKTLPNLSNQADRNIIYFVNLPKSLK